MDVYFKSWSSNDNKLRVFAMFSNSFAATTDAKKTIFDICPDNNDSLVAVIEVCIISFI